ncbi:response regulator [Candidatus Thorarchaeota archaeon]|nr:MAG: response regulator [Candidatus Thorarchaeota archaeon]
MSKTVLVVDDDDDLFFLVEKYLKKTGERVELVSASTGQRALQLIETANIDAIFCDCQICEESMDALELLEWVRNANIDTPFILFTDNSTQSTAIRALSMRADYYLKKDAENLESLFAQLNRHIDLFVEMKRIETACEDTKEELERKVKDKTEDLQRMNSLLEAEITQKEQAEQALIESEERLQLALWGADLGLWNLDVESGETVYNDRWAEMLGYSLDEIEQLDSTWREFLHPDDLDKALALWQEHCDGKREVYEARYRMRAKDSSWRWILDRGKVYIRRDDGRPVKAAGTHLDITDAVRREEKLHEVTRRQAERDSRHLTKVCNAVLERLNLVRAAVSEGVCEDKTTEIREMLDDIDSIIDEGMKGIPSRGERM